MVVLRDNFLSRLILARIETKLTTKENNPNVRLPYLNDIWYVSGAGAKGVHAQFWA